MTTSRLLLIALWAGLVAIAATAPANEDTGALVMDLAKFEDHDRIAVMVFQLMGVWPLAYALVLLVDDPAANPSRVPPWPFIVASFALGAFALVPYLALRSADAAPRPTDSWAPRLGRNRAFAGFVVVSGLALFVYGLLAFDPVAFAGRLQTDGFVRTYSADFCALWLASSILVIGDVARHGARPRHGWWAAVPVVGPALWALARR